MSELKRVVKRTLIPDDTVYALMHGKTMYGWGASYEGEDISQSFIEQNVACIGHDLAKAPEFVNIILGAKQFDIVFLKAFGPSSESLRILAVGYFPDNAIYEDESDLDLGIGKKVIWKFTGSHQLEDNLGYDKLRNNRLGTVYEETHQAIQRVIIDMLLNPEEYTEE